MVRKPELLAPAGNFEKLQVAIAYGADAVYLGGDSFGLRANAGNFNRQEIKDAATYTHKQGVKLYVTLNIFPHNQDLTGLEEYLKYLQEQKVDGLIISDPGIFSMARIHVPGMDIHISTQANTLNWATANFWHTLGATRIILARELSLVEIGEIHAKTDIELEAFVHGAMCISYSGRCYLSQYMTGRDANLGSCTQPCRWSYAIMEEKRPGVYFPVDADQDGTYIMNSKDLCMIQHIPALIQSGLNSLKIEGRMKSVHYVATVTKVYREAIDSFISDPLSYSVRNEWLDELIKASNREFTTGFYLGRPDGLDDHVNYSGYVRPCDFVGIVLDYDEESSEALIEQRNHVRQGETVEVLSPARAPFNMILEGMRDIENNPIEVAPHPQMKFRIHCTSPVKELDLLRRIK